MKRTALITSAYAAGIGSAITKVFADEGWSVIACYDPANKLESDLAKKDTTSHKLMVDLRSSRSINAMNSQLPVRIDAFVHAAMFFEMDAGFDHLIWEQTLQVNVLAAAQIVDMVRGRLRGGSVVAISSTEAFTGSFGSAAYSASRAAMHNLVQSWSNQLGPDGIRANAVAAGWIGGVMDTDEVFNKSRRITPLGRLGLPGEVAATVKFLCSNEASFINGSVVTVDGGYSGVDSVSRYEYQEYLATNDFDRFTTEFMTGRAGEGDEIWAVSLLWPGEWRTDDPIKIEQQIAARRGAIIKRIFVVSDDCEELREGSELLRLHQAHPNIQAYRVDRDKIKESDAELLKRLENGWTAFNDEVLVLDEASGGETRGLLITHSSQLASKRADFEALLKQASQL